MNEIWFMVKRTPEGGYTARSFGASIFTESADYDSPREQVRDAVLCHFERDGATSHSPVCRLRRGNRDMSQVTSRIPR